ncbi:hypothetical protein SEUCBS139899_004250 [Sporothrix eucalyptigena]
MPGKRLSLNNAAAPCTLTIPDGPSLHGFVSVHGVANYLNVPYAQIPARFRTASLLSLGDLSGDLDATKYGPRCPQGPDHIHILMNHLFECLPMEQYSAEFSCLDVNIYTPENVDPSARLPVFVWIHGGAFRAGCNTVEWDGNHLVKRSVRLGQPIVVVSINYRLGLLGFLSSTETEVEAVAAGETPIRNQGINDQKLALQWIQKHIHLFGGDPDNVTVGGESAGAMSVHYLLKCRTETPLFRRGLICSSPDVAISLRPVSDGQAQFDALVEAANVSAKAPYQVKLAALRSYTPEELMGMLPPAMALAVPSPVPDRNWFVDWEDDTDVPPRGYWSKLPEWCSEVIVGCTKDEMALFLASNETVGWTDEQAKAKIGAAVGTTPGLVEAIWDAPSLRSPDGTTPLGRVVTFGTDHFIRSPTNKFAAAVAKQCPDHRVYLYSIDIVDPFPGTSLDGTPLEGTGKNGPLNNFAWHSFGNAIMFYQPACQKDAELGATADKITEAHMNVMYGKMSNGEQSWEPFDVAGRKMSWNGTKSGIIDAGCGLYDPVGDHLRTLGDDTIVQAYEAFKTDPRRLRGLIG